MAKKNGKLGILAIISACAGIGAICVGGSTIGGRWTAKAGAKATQAHIVEDTTKAVDGLKEEGCKPAVKAVGDVRVIGVEMKHLKDNVADMKKDVGGLKADFADYRVEQRKERAEDKKERTAETEKILKAIHEKP